MPVSVVEIVADLARFSEQHVVVVSATETGCSFWLFVEVVCERPTMCTIWLASWAVVIVTVTLTVVCHEQEPVVVAE